MALANITVSVTEPNIAVSSDNVNVSVSSTTTDVTVGNATVVANADIYSALSVSNVSGFGNIAFDNSVTSNGIIQYTGVSASDIRSQLSNTSPILYNSSTGVISFDANLDDLTLKKYQETIVDGGTTSGNISLDISQGTVHKFILNGNVTGISFSNLDTGGSATLQLTQDGTGGRYLDTTTFTSNWTNFKFLNNDTTLSGSPNKLSIINVFYNGTNYIASVIPEENLEVNFSNITATGNITAANIVGTYLHGDGSNITGVASLTNFSVTTNTPSGNGALAYSNSTGVFSFTPADTSGSIGLTDLSVTQASASGAGTLAYNNSTGVFTYTPPDLTSFGLTNAQAQAFIQSNGLAMTANVTSNSIISTTSTISAGSSATDTHSLTGNLNVTGNVEVSGNLNYRNVEDLQVQNTELIMNANAASDATVSFVVNRPTAGANTVLRWNETDDKWQFSNDGSAYQNLIGLTNLSVTQASASGTGTLAYANTTGVFTYTPPDLSSFGTSSLTNAQAQAFIQTSGLALTANVTSNSLISTTGNVQINPDTLAGGLKGFTFDAATNRLGLGTTTPEAAIHIESDNDFDSQIFMKEFKSSNAGNDMRIYKAAGTLASPTTLQGGNRIFEILNYGYDGSAFQNRLSQIHFVDSTVPVSSGVVPMGWELKGSVDGTGTGTSLLKLRGNGAVQVGSMGTDDSNSGVEFQVLNSGAVSTTSTITATGNITGNYILGNGVQLSGLSTSIVSEGSNQYYTDSRSRAALSLTQNSASGTGTLSYNDSTGAFVYTPPDLSTFGTSSLTNAQAQAFIQSNGLAMTSLLSSNANLTTTANINTGGATLTGVLSSTGNVQINSETDVSGLSGLTFDTSTNNLGLGTPTPKAAIHIRGTSNESQMYMSEFNGTSSAGIDLRTYRAAGDETTPDFVTNNKRIWERFHHVWDGVGSASDGITSGFRVGIGEQILTEQTMSNTATPVYYQLYNYRDGDNSQNPTAFIKARANGDIEFATPIGSAFDQDALPAVIIDKDGIYTSNANITTTANVSGTNVIGTYLYGDGTNISGIGGSVNSFQTIAVSGQSSVVADSSTDTLTLAASGAITITTDAATDTITIGGSGGTYGNSDVSNYLSANVQTANITTQGNVNVNKDIIADNDIKSANAMFADAIHPFTGGGTFTMNALRVTDFKASDPLGINSVANSSLSGGVYAAPFTGSIVYVTGDRHGSRGAPCYFDGTSWRYFSDDANVTI